MPSFIHGKGSKVLFNSYDLSSYFNNVDAAFTIETAESTAFGDSAKNYIVGLQDGTLALSGMFDNSAIGNNENLLQEALGSSTTPLVTVVLDSGAIGARSVQAKAHETNYAISSPIGDIVTVAADFNASTDGTANVKEGILTGTMLTSGASQAYGALGPLASVDNTAASTDGAVANLHVTDNSITGGATTIKVQSSADNSTFADLMTFTAVSASTIFSQQIAVSGSVPRYLRASASTAGSAGSITYNISIARF
jgi:hypothetical protein